MRLIFRDEQQHEEQPANPEIAALTRIRRYHTDCDYRDAVHHHLCEIRKQREARHGR